MVLVIWSFEVFGPILVFCKLQKVSSFSESTARTSAGEAKKNSFRLFARFHPPRHEVLVEFIFQLNGVFRKRKLRARRNETGPTHLQVRRCAPAVPAGGLIQFHDVIAERTTVRTDIDVARPNVSGTVVVLSNCTVDISELAL